MRACYKIGASGKSFNPEPTATAIRTVAVGSGLNNRAPPMVE